MNIQQWLGTSNKLYSTIWMKQRVVVVNEISIIMGMGQFSSQPGPQAIAVFSLSR